MAATYRHINTKALARYWIILFGEQRHVGVNNLPKVIARQCSSRESNPRSAHRESSALTTTPPSHHVNMLHSGSMARAHVYIVHHKLHHIIIGTDHSIPQNTEFSAEPQNLPVSVEFLRFRGIRCWGWYGDKYGIFFFVGFRHHDKHDCH